MQFTIRIMSIARESKLCIDMFVKRYAAFDVDHIAGLDARGFVLGAPIALALKKVAILRMLMFCSKNIHG